MFQAKKEENLSFVISNIQNFGGGENQEHLMGIFDTFEQAKNAFEEIISNHALDNMRNDTTKINDLLGDPPGIENIFNLDAFEKNKPVYNHKINMGSAHFVNSAPDIFSYTTLGDLGRSYNRCLKLLEDNKASIETLFSKEEPDIGEVKFYQQREDEIKQSKELIENTFKPSFIEDTFINYKDIVKNETNDFIANLDDKLKKANPEKYDELQEVLNKNTNSGIMEHAFNKAVKFSR